MPQTKMIKVIDVTTIPKSTRVHFGLHEKGADCPEFLIRDLAQNPRSLRFEALIYKVNAVVTCVGRNRSKPILALQFGPGGALDYDFVLPDGTKELISKLEPWQVFEYCMGRLGDLWFNGHYNDTEELWLSFAVKPK